jgi:hypothetical protein
MTSLIDMPVTTVGEEEYPEDVQGWASIYLIGGYQVLHYCAFCWECSAVNKFPKDAQAVLRAVAKTLPEQPEDVKEV